MQPSFGEQYATSGAVSRPDNTEMQALGLRVCLGDKHIIQLLDMNVMILISAALCYTIVFQCSYSFRSHGIRKSIHIPFW